MNNYGYSTHNYYMASFCAVIRYWSKMELSCLLRTTRHVLKETFHQKPYNKSLIDQACPVKVAEYWLCFFFGKFVSVHKHAKKDLGNISLRSKQFRGVGDQRRTKEWDFQCWPTRKMVQEPNIHPF